MRIVQERAGRRGEPVWLAGRPEQDLGGSGHPRQRPEVLRQAQVLAVVDRDFDESRAVHLERLHQRRVEIVGGARAGSGYVTETGIG